MKDVATDTDDLTSVTKDVGTQTHLADDSIDIQTLDCDLETSSHSPKLSYDPDSDDTILYTPDKAFDPDNVRSVSDDEFDSDATRLDTPDTKVSGNADSDSTSSGSYIETYTSDPSYTGPTYASLPCSRHGVSYTPPGWKRVSVKRRKLEFTACENSPSDK